MELVLTLPVLAVVLFAVFEFSLLFSARSAMVEAGRAGARKASLAGATNAAVRAEVRAVLPPRLRRSADIRVQTGRFSGDLVAVQVVVPMSAASPDLLWPIGYRLKGRMLRASSQRIRE